MDVGGCLKQRSITKSRSERKMWWRLRVNDELVRSSDQYSQLTVNTVYGVFNIYKHYLLYTFCFFVFRIYICKFLL